MDYTLLLIHNFVWLLQIYFIHCIMVRWWYPFQIDKCVGIFSIWSIQRYLFNWLFNFANICTVVFPRIYCHDFFVYNMHYVNNSQLKHQRSRRPNNIGSLYNSVKLLLWIGEDETLKLWITILQSPILAIFSKKNHAVSILFVVFLLSL